MNNNIVIDINCYQHVYRYIFNGTAVKIVYIIFSKRCGIDLSHTTRLNLINVYKCMNKV